jgi:hypothetical protein
MQYSSFALLSAPNYVQPSVLARLVVSPHDHSAAVGEARAPLAFAATLSVQGKVGAEAPSDEKPQLSRSSVRRMVDNICCIYEFVKEKGQVNGVKNVLCYEIRTRRI